MKLTSNFDREEFECQCGCGYDTVDIGLMAVLQNARDYFGVPFTVNSGCRCVSHNKAVGGSENSQHLIGRAADISMPLTVTPKELYDYLDNKYPKTLGLGLYDTFVHIDSRRKKARW